MVIDIIRQSDDNNDVYKKAYQKGYRHGRMSAFLEAIEMVKKQEQIKVDSICNDLYNEDQKNKTQESIK